MIAAAGLIINEPTGCFKSCRAW